MHPPPTIVKWLFYSKGDTMRTYKFGIMGSGMIAHIHAKAIQKIPNAAIAGIYGPVTESVQEFAAKYQCRVYLSSEEMLADEEVDVVNICTPSGIHAELAIAAARANKHVIVEKPLAVNKEDAQAVVRVQKETGVKICVISQLRFSSGVQALRDAVRHGKLGRMIMGSLSMLYYRSEEYYQNGGWRGRWSSDGGGALMNQGIHGLDLLSYICGPVVSVRAFYKTLFHDIEAEDTLCAILEFKNGALGTVEASTAIKPGSPRKIHIGGTQGSAVLTEDAITEWRADEPVPDSGEHWQTDAANDPSALDVTGHLLQFKNLLASIEGREELLVDAAAGCSTVELVLAIYESARSGKTVNLEMSEKDI